jgi:hypothetical protein
MYRLLASFVLIFGATAPARAEVVYDVFFQFQGQELIDDVLLVSPGTRFDAVDVIFRETVTGSSQPVVGNSQLGRVGIAIVPTGGSGDVTDFATNPLFTIGVLPDAIAGFTFDVGPALEEIGTDSGIFQASVGTVSLIAPSTPFETTVFRMGDLQPGSNNFRGIAGQTIDDSAINFRQLTITAIPEPSGVFALVALAGGVVATSRRRRP